MSLFWLRFRSRVYLTFPGHKAGKQEGGVKSVIQLYNSESR